MRSLIPIENPPIGQDWFGVWYAPLSGETDPADLAFVRRLGARPWRVVPPQRHADPFALADIFVREMPPGARVYVLVPGRRFDRFGTRHGRGGGWYDRFLSAVPRTWLRVGVLRPDQLRDEPLSRQDWDEPMDWLVRA